MRRMALAAVLMTVMLGSAAQVDAATLVVVLNPDGSQDIDINIEPTPPGEFKALLSSWGRLTYQGGLVAYYVFAREDKIHSGSQAPTNYPNPWMKLVIRTLGNAPELLVLEGAAHPDPAGSAFGAVTVATGPLGFLRNARYKLESGVLTFTY